MAGCCSSPQNAATLYALVAENGLENTKVTLVGLTPGGEGKVASSAPAKSPWFSRGSGMAFSRACLGVDKGRDVTDR